MAAAVEEATEAEATAIPVCEGNRWRRRRGGDDGRKAATGF